MFSLILQGDIMWDKTESNFCMYFSSGCPDADAKIILQVVSDSAQKPPTHSGKPHRKFFGSEWDNIG